MVSPSYALSYSDLTLIRLPHYDIYCNLVRLVFPAHAAFQGHLHWHPGPARSSVLVHPRAAVSETPWVDQSESTTTHRLASRGHPVLCVSWSHLAVRRLEDRVGDVHCSYILRDGECTIASAGSLTEYGANYFESSYMDRSTAIREPCTPSLYLM